MISPRSWIFIISVLLIRHSVALESINADFIQSVTSEEYPHPAVLDRPLNGTGISLLTTRGTGHPVHVGAIVGGTVGGVVVIGLCVFAFVYYYRRKRIGSIEDGIQPPAPKTTWRDRLKILRTKQPHPSPSDESLAPRELPSPESSFVAVTEEKGPAAPQVKGVAANLRDIPPTPSPTASVDRPLPPGPSRRLEVVEGTSTFVVALSSTEGDSHSSLKLYDTSKRSSRRKVQIPPQAVIISNPITLKSTSGKRQSRSGISRDMLEGVQKSSKSKYEPRRRSLLSGFRPPVSQEAPSVTPITQTDVLHKPAQGLNWEEFQRILQVSREKEKEMLNKFASTLPGRSAETTQ